MSAARTSPGSDEEARPGAAYGRDVDATAVPPTVVAAARRNGDPRAARVFISDVRLAAAVLNEARLIALRRTFGVSRQQADALTFVLALTAADATLRTAHRVTHAGLPSRGDTAMGGFLLREAALGIAGPGARKVPFAGAFLAGAMLAGIALPELRRAAHGLREAERRVRTQRMRVYAAAGRATERVREAVE
jgi:hypothetical protein